MEHEMQDASLHPDSSLLRTSSGDVAVVKLIVASVRKEVRTYSVTYHARLEGHLNDLATLLLQQPPHNRRLKRYYPADLVTNF
jgi:hypothetical protein